MDGILRRAYVDGGRLNSNSTAINNATSAPFPAGGLNTSQWGGGVQLGFDYMLPSRLLLGVTADMSSGGTRTSTVSDPTGISANETTVFDSETVRGKLGYAADNILFYATGGLAWSNDQFVRTQLTGTLNAATAGTDEAVNKGLPGWTAGGGIAYAFAQNWSVFAEFRHTGFATSSASLPFSQLTTTSTINANALQLGVNYRFISGGSLRTLRSLRIRQRSPRQWPTKRRLSGLPTTGPASISVRTAAWAGQRRMEH